MGAGIRNICGKCFSNDYDIKLQRCNKCGWTQASANPTQKGLEEFNDKCDGCKYLKYEKETNATICTIKGECEVIENE